MGKGRRGRETQPKPEENSEAETRSLSPSKPQRAIPKFPFQQRLVVETSARKMFWQPAVLMKSTVIDLKKAQWADFIWTNGSGVERKKKPRKPTVNGDRFDEKAKAFGGDGETMLERAKRKGLLDVWTPKVIFQYAANHKVEFFGSRAKALWKEWNRLQFGKSKRK